jgi:prophage DNA circulation protein
MTTEQRIDRLEILAETTLLAIQHLALQQRELALQQRDAQADMRASVVDLVDMIGTLSQNADRHWEAIQEMQSEVRGLQTENRRILERLEGHLENGHSHG